MKKILFFHHNTISVGAGLSALQILTNISSKEYSICVCLPSCDGDLSGKLASLNIKIRTDFKRPYSYLHVSGYHYPAISKAHVHNLIQIKEFRKTARKVINEEKPDFVIVNSLTLFWIGKEAKQCLNNVVTICFDRETYYKGIFGVRMGYIKRELNKYFDKIAFLSYYDMKQTGDLKQKYVRITDKVDLDLYAQLDQGECRKVLGLPEKDKLVLFTGGMSKLKGITTVLRSLNWVRDGIKIIILQYQDEEKKRSNFVAKIKKKLSGDCSEWCERYIKRNNLSSKLILYGRTDRVALFFTACDAVIFPSTEPHQARPVFEAGAAKKPIIITNFENTSEFVDNNNSWLVENSNSEQLAETINAVCTGSNEVRKKVYENYSRVKKNNDIKKLPEEIKKLLEGKTDNA